MSVNKRLDEWVTEAEMDLAKLEMPKAKQPEAPVTAPNVKTPLKVMNGSSSRPCSRANSPDRDYTVSCMLTHPPGRDYTVSCSHANSPDRHS